MQGAENKEMWRNRGRKQSWVWNWVRKGWLRSRVQEVLGPTGGITHPPSGVSEDQPCPQQVAQVGIAVMTLLSASSSVSLSPVLYPTSLILHTERAVAVLPHDGKTVKKALQARSTLTGRDLAPFLLSQDPFFPPGWERSGWRPGIRKPGHLPSFQDPLVNNRRLLLSQNHFKGSRAPEPCSPRTSSVGAAYRSWVRTWDQHSFLLPKEQQNSWRSGQELQSIHWGKWTWE